MPKFADFAGNKEYECKKCHKNTKFAKFYDDVKGELLTVDGKEPNGKFGKETNVFSARVNLDKTIHDCYPPQWPKPQSDFKEHEPPEPEVLGEPPKVKEMSVADIAEPALRRETLVNLKVLKVIEDEVIKFLGKDTNPAKVGMFMKLVMDMGKKN